MMENKVIDFESDETLQYILASVIKRKEIVNKLKAKEKKWKILFLASVTTVISYFFFIFQSGFFTTFSEFFSFLLGNMGHLMFLLLTVSLYFYTVQLQKKGEKAEKTFQDLRCEIIKRSKELWATPETWEHRKETFRWMQSTYGINLYHENK
ncbi:DUF2663 family protein [Priestia aryabhattai]|nr:DUF2663 family protein [Priestia aryabhattai]